MATKILCSTKTKTTVKSGAVRIKCFSDENEFGTKKPNIYSAEILTESSKIDGVKGKEGELIICYDNEKDDVVELNSGDLLVNAKNDDSDKYSLDINGTLIYTF